MSFDGLNGQMNIKCECTPRPTQTVESEMRGIQAQSDVDMSQNFTDLCVYQGSPGIEIMLNVLTKDTMILTP